MSNNYLSPALRFIGFTDDWKLHKLRELGEFTSNGVDKKIYPDETIVNLLNYMDVYNRREVNAQNCQELMQVSAKKSQIKNNNILKNDVFFTPTSETADDIGHVMVIEETLENTVYSYHLMRFRPHEGVFYSIFPNYCLNTGNIRKQMSLMAQGVQRYVLSKANFENLNVLLPDIAEQEKISEFLRNIDNLIIFHQRKYNRLIQVKKAMLLKMFPRFGENVPEIRFSGFTESWKQCKLKDVVKEFYNGKTPYRQNNAYWNGDVNWLSSGDLNRGIITHTTEKITEEGKEANGLRIMPKGTLVIAIMGLEAEGTRGNCGILGIDTTINQACMALIVDSDIVSSDFLFQWYKCFGNSYALRFAQGTKQQNYNAEILGDLDISYPSMREQERIGEFLLSIDNLITLSQHKLVLLNNLKQSMQQIMFP